MLRSTIPGLVALGCLLVGQAYAGQDPPANSPEAKQLLDRVIASYKALPAYADEGEVGLSLTINGQAKSSLSKASLAFERPNKVVLDTGVVRLSSDGTSLASVVAPLRRYSVAPAPGSFAGFDLSAGPLAATMLGGPTGIPPLMIFHLLTSDDPNRFFERFAGSFRLEPDKARDGKPHRVLLLDAAEGPDFRFLIDPTSHLIQSIELVFDPSALAGQVPGNETRVDRFAWEAGEIRTEPAGPGTFTFKAPDQFEKVATLAEAFGDQAAGVAAENDSALVGKPAPAFSLTIYDGPDKTRRLTKAELEGKVVLIDFWATWCAPCLRELPDIQTLVRDYAKAEKPLVVVALSVDQAESPAAARKLIEATLKERKIELTGNAVGLVGHDEDGTVAQVYEANAIPMLVLIDAKGVVQAVHVGYTEPGKLRDEIDAVLAGKSLSNEGAGKVDAQN